VFANEEKTYLTEGHLTYKRTPDETHPLFTEMIKENRHLYHRDSNLENQTDLISLDLIENVKTV
jgi:hypothetical protein